jgi:ArsR family transcriptional regulator
MARTRTTSTVTAAPCCAPLQQQTIDDDGAVVLAASFAALGDPARLRLLSLIANAPTGEACACDLIEPLGKSQPTVSHHLKVLHDAGLIERDKRGVWMWFRVNQAKVEQLRALLG